MSKAELVRTVAIAGGLTEPLASQVFDAIEQAAVKALKRDGEFTLPGFGKLKVIKTKARKGRNPKTGETIQIPAGKRVKLSVSKSLKDQVT